MPSFLVLAPVFLACYATKVLRAPSLMPEEPVSALMVSTIVETQQQENSDSLVGAIQTGVDLANNAELDMFGGTVEPALTTWLTTMGVNQAADKTRLMTGKDTDWAAVANDFTVLSGTWVDPDGLGMRIATDTLFGEGPMRTLAERVGAKDPRELYSYTTVTVVPMHEWLFVGVPRVRVSVVVHDRDGKPVLRARAWGVGQRTAFFIDRSPDSLGKGFAEAMANLAEAEIEPLD